LADRVWEHSLKNPYGFTLDVETLKPVRFGFAVAFAETQDCHGREGLEKALRHAMENERTVGGWLDAESGRYYFDSVRVFPDTEMDRAERFAGENGQLAFFDLLFKKEIRLDGGGA